MEASPRGHGDELMPGKKKGKKKKRDEGSNEMITTLGTKINQLKNLGFKIGGFRKDLKTLEKEYGKKEGKPENIQKRLDRKVKEAWQEWELERLEYYIGITERAISISKDRGLDDKDLSELLKGLKKDLGSKDFEVSKERMNSVRKELDNLFKDQNDIIVSESLEAFDKGLDSYLDVARDTSGLKDAKKYFKKVKNYAKKSDLDNLIVYSNLLLNSSQKELSEELVKDRFKDIKSEIDELLDRIKTFKEYGIEPEGFEKELMKLDHSMDPKHFAEVKNRVTHIDKSLSRIEKEYFRKKGHVHLLEVSDSINEYGNLIDFGDASEKMEKLMEDETTISPKRFQDESENVLKSVRESLYTNFEPQVMERMESLDVSLESSDIEYKDDLEMIQELKGMADGALVNGHITEAMEYLSMAENIIGNINGEAGLERIRTRYIDLLEDYEVLLDEDLEMEELKGLLGDLESMFLEDDVKKDEISDKLAKAEEEVFGRRIQVRKKKLDNVRREITNTFETFSLSDKETEKILKEAEELESDIDGLEEGEFNSRINELNHDFEGVLGDFFKDNHTQWLSNVKGSLEELEGEGVEAKEMKDDLKKAEDMLSSEDYLEGGMILRRMKDDIEDIRKERETKEIEELINSAEFLYEEARRAGVEIAEGDEKLKEAKAKLIEGNLQEARELSTSFESDVKSGWMEFKREHLRGDIEEIREFMEDNVEIGLEIGEVDQLLEDAEKLFEKEEFDEVNHIIEKARDTITEERNHFFSEGAMKGIAEIKEEISSMEEMGVNKLEVETLLIEAERLFMNEDYESAYSMTLDIREKIRDSKEEYLESTVPKEMKKTLQDITRLEVMGLDTGSARDLINTASGKMKEGDLEGSMSAIQDAKEISDEIYKSHISMTIPETLVDVKKEIDQAAEEGIDLQEVEELMADAESLFLNEEYDQAMEMIDKARGTFEERKNNHYKDQFDSQISNVESMINQASDLDVELELSQDNVNMARDAFERGDYQASHTLLQRVMNYLEKSMNDHKTLKRKEVVLNNLEEVQTLIRVAREENIDVSDDMRNLDLVHELLDNKEIDQAEGILEGIKNGINDKRISRKRNLIESSIKTTQILLDNMSSMGIDVSYETSLMEKLKEGLRRGDLVYCTGINKKLEESLQNNKAPYLFQKLQQDIPEMKARIEEARKSGVETQKMNKIMEKAIKRYSEGDIEGTQKALDQVRELLDAADRVRSEKEYEEFQNKLKGKIAEMSEMGVPTEDEEGLLTKAEEMFNEGEPDEAITWLFTAIEGGEAKIKSFHSTAAKGYLSQIEEYLEELSNKGLDISNLEKLFSEGRNLHEEGDDRRAIGKFTSILDIGEEMRKIKEDKEITEKFTTWDRRYKEMKKLGLKPSKELKKLRKGIRNGLKDEDTDPEQIENIFSDFKEALRTEGGPYFERLSKKHIAEASKKFKELSEKRTLDPNIKNMIMDAGKKFRGEDFEEADIQALSAMELMAMVTQQESEEAIREELSSVKQMLTRLKSMGSNVSTPEQLLSKVELALKEGKIEAANKLIKSIRRSIKDIVKRNMRESSKETIEFAEALIHYLIDNFTGISKKLSPAENKLQEAREMFSKKKYKAAQKIATEAQKQAEDVDLSNIKQFLFVFRSMQAEEALRDVSIRMQELAQKKIDLSKAKILYREAEENFDKGNHDKGREMITLTRILLSELDQQSLREKAFDELNGAHVDILSMKRKGANIQNAYKIYENAKNAFSLQEYKKTILLAKKASSKVKGVASN